MALERAGERVSIAVEDSGTGIHRPTYRTFSSVFIVPGGGGDGGHGLGLSLAQSIARAHGTAIEVTSRHGSGSKFQVTFDLRAVIG